MGDRAFPSGNETYRMLGACFEGYNEKGPGFLKPVYQECLELELLPRRVPFDAKKPLQLEYKGHPLSKGYEPDFICFESVIMEIKAVAVLAGDHRAQLLNYLKATGLQVGLLVNFGHYPKLEYERLVNTRQNDLR